MNSIYGDYLNRFSDILARKPLQKTFSTEGGIEKGICGTILNETRDAQLVPATNNQLAIWFGEPVGAKTVPTIGTHPNFKDLAFGERRYQYCASMFIDIKGSTNLALSYSLEQVRMMKDAILSLCIQTVTLFGGHIQRLQGDGLYVQFTDANIHQNTMMVNALNAASVLCQFISTSLAELFVQHGLKPLRIKVGIDFAENDKCLWSHYGVPGCNELTATSLHVDLAAKLQARCESNEIRIGQYVKEFLDLPSEFVKVPKTAEGKDDYYIKSVVNYRQYIFDWKTYLKMFSFVHKGDNRLEIEQPDFKLACEVSNISGQKYQYYQNNGTLPKGQQLTFTLMRNGSNYSKTPYDEIAWRIVNRGNEASKDNHLVEVLEEYKNRTVAIVNTAYLGHHYIECVIKRTYEKNNRKIQFGVYVR